MHIKPKWTRIASMLVLLLLGPVGASSVVHAALPEGGTIVSGGGAIGATSDAAGQLTIEQTSERMIIDWEGFSIGEGNAVHFAQTRGADAVALNRVVGNGAGSSAPSEILGSLTASGQVFLLNPQGVIFGANARVDVGGLVASTLALTAEDFMRGQYRFHGGSDAGAIVNEGELHGLGVGAAAGGGSGEGYVVLIAPEVRNDGTVTAQLGTVAMAAGGEVTLDVLGGGLVRVAIDADVAGASIVNSDTGLLQADGGLVTLAATAAGGGSGGPVPIVLNQQGTVRANTVTSEDGRIVLSGGPVGDVAIGGIVEATGDVEVEAGRDIVVTGTIVGRVGGGTGGGSGGSGDLVLRADASGSGAGTVVFLGGGHVDYSASSGNVEILYNPESAGSAGTGSDHKFNHAADYTDHVTLGTNSKLIAYMLVNDIHDLQDMRHNLAGTYALGRDIDAGETRTWNEEGGVYKGFEPIGSSFDTAFMGMFDGRGRTVDGLFVHREDTILVGLFGYTGVGSVIRHIGLTNVDVVGRQFVGGLVGRSRSLIDRAFTTGNVQGMYHDVGGLVGYNEGAPADAAVQFSYSAAHVEGNSSVGGLVGTNDSAANISHSYSTGDVRARAYGTGILQGRHAGGFVGFNSGDISHSYSTGQVTGENKVGGFVGDHVSGSITQSYSTGRVVSSGALVGGFAGNASSSSITSSFWDTETSGQTVGVDGGSASGIAGFGTGVMMGQQTFENLGWDFGEDGDWFMIDGETRPFLRSEYSTEIRNVHQLQLMAMDVNASYTMANDIDLTDWWTEAVPGDASSRVWNASGMWSERGFVPVGGSDFTDRFTGSFDGQGHVIDGLYIHRSHAGGVGLFGRVMGGSIRSVALTNVDVVGSTSVGGIVGWNIGGTITDASSGGTVHGHYAVGGLVGESSGHITRSHSEGLVEGSLYVGGLVGDNNGTIDYTFSTSAVKYVAGAGNGPFGGLVGGHRNGAIAFSYSAGDVAGGNIAGGLVGTMDGGATILHSYSTGGVSGTMYAGGLVGTVGLLGSVGGGAISHSYSTGAVTRADVVGGLVGELRGGEPEESVLASFWDVERSGQSTSAGGIGITTAQMQSADFWAEQDGWRDDVDATGEADRADTVWRLYDGQSAPLLKAFMRSVTVAVGDRTVTYDGQEHGSNVTISDPDAVLLGTYMPPKFKDAGAYDIHVAGLYSDQQGYDIRYESGTLTITPRPITVTADSLSKVYGDQDPGLTYRITGGNLVGGDTLTGTLVRGGDQNAGVYVIGQGSLTSDNNSNYDITFVDGRLTIAPRPITITADSLFKVYGEADPNRFAFQVDGPGLIRDDAFDDVFSGALARQIGEDVGTYAIVRGDLMTNGNYEITGINGTFEIDPASLQGIVQDARRMAGQQNPDFTVQYVGFLRGDDERVLDGTLVFETDADVHSLGGTYSVRAYGLTARNYTITFVPGALHVADAAPQFDWSCFAAFTDDDNPRGNCSFGGFGSMRQKVNGNSPFPDIRLDDTVWRSADGI